MRASRLRLRTRQLHHLVPARAVPAISLIARVWKGWTTRENAADYQRLLQEKVLPGLKRIEGYRGGCVLTKDDKDGQVEFLVLNFFESLEAVRRFAGSDYTVPVFEPEVRDCLTRSNH